MRDQGPDLFETARRDDPTGVPLAERMRPQTLDEVVGQAHLSGDDGILARAVKTGRIPSVVFWGPPGTGKTTLAEALCRAVDARFVRLSAVLAGVKDIRAAVDEARRARNEYGKKTLLFVDEIHRFNKSQQDALLPHVERGVVTLVGATTENPSFEVNAALLSRCRVLVTRAIGEDALQTLLDRALTLEARGLGERALTLDDDARAGLVQAAGGDARRLLTSLEVAADMAEAEGTKAITLAHVEQAVARRVVLFDKAGESHFDVISAFIKSLRGSDPDAALHYLARMLEGGEAPRFVLRRLVVFASEDIGNADPHALTVATAAVSAFELVGLPEGALAITQATAYLACAPKSNAVVNAWSAAKKDALDHPDAAVPMHIRNAPTGLMKELGYGEGYRYPHDFEGHYVPGAQYLPDALVGRRYYVPSDQGKERAIGDRLERLRALTAPRRKQGPSSYSHGKV